MAPTASVAYRFQFLGIPPKGEHLQSYGMKEIIKVSFQFLGIPPKGEPSINRFTFGLVYVSSFQFLGIPPKGEPLLTA